MLVRLLDLSKRVTLFGQVLSAEKTVLYVSKTALLNTARVQGAPTSSDLTDLEALFKTGLIQVIDSGVPVTSFAGLMDIIDNGYPSGGGGSGNATSIQGIPVDSTPPSFVNDTLKFDGTKYVPAPGGGAPSGVANALSYFNGAGVLTGVAGLTAGNLDPFGRPQIHDKRTNAGRGAIIRIGSWGMDGDPDNVKSEGLVLYGCNSLGNGPDGTQGGMFFATTGTVGVGQIIPAVNGGNMFYAFGFENASPDNPGFGPANKFIINDDTATSVFEVNRLLGTTIIGSAGVVNGGLQLGGLDPFGRPMIRDSRVGGAGVVWRQGQWQSDGDPLNIEGEGIVCVGKSTNGVLSAGEGAYARVKKDRFGLYQITPAVPAGYYMFRVDGTSLTLRDDAGVLSFESVRATGVTWARELRIGSATGPRVLAGAGSPEGAVVGNPGDLYTNTSGGAGTTLYVKESGIGTNTGWIGK